MFDTVIFSDDDRLIIARIAQKRGISFVEASQLLACSDLKRNTSGGVESSCDVARFRLGEPDS